MFIRSDAATLPTLVALSAEWKGSICLTVDRVLEDKLTAKRKGRDAMRSKLVGAAPAAAAVMAARPRRARLTARGEPSQILTAETIFRIRQR